MYSICLLNDILFSTFLPTDSKQTEELSSYQLTVPRAVGGRPGRAADGRRPSQVTVSLCTQYCFSTVP